MDTDNNQIEAHSLIIYDMLLLPGALPSTIQSLTFGDSYNQPISVGVLPPTLQSLTFGDGYNQPISVGVLPESLQSLTFGDSYNQAISVGTLPSTLQSLTFGDSYNQAISDGVLPSSLQSLTFGDSYNQEIPVGVLPSSLQSLVFGNEYNQAISVGVLPSSLQSLTFDDRYNQAISVSYNQAISVGVLPSSLQSLTLGDNYNQPLSVGVLPSSLLSLTFGWHYNQPISVGVLPSTLQSLVFGDGYRQPLSVGVLPSSLLSLTFGWHYDQPISVGVLPSTLQSLVFGDGYRQPLSVGVLPSSLKSLTLGRFYEQPLSIGVLPSSLQSFFWEYNHPIPIGVFPSSLQSLTFGREYNQPISVGALPTSLQSLTFGDRFNQPISIGVLPSTLQSLTFGSEFNQPSIGVLPSTLQSLTFGYGFNQEISIGVLPSSLQSLELDQKRFLSTGVLPSSLQSLKLSYSNDQPLSVGVLPSSLQSLKLRYRNDQPLSVGELPSSLQSLEFYYYNKPLSRGVLPSSLQSLVFGNYFIQPLSPGVLPTSLQSLTFGDRYNQAISIGVLPSSLQSLTLNRHYDQPISFGVLPQSMQSLTFNIRGGDSTTILCDFKQSIQVSKNYIRIGLNGLVKLPSKIGSIIFTTTRSSPSDIDIAKCFSNQTTQSNTNLQSNPNSINRDPKYVLTYPISQTEYVTVNNNKYFKLYPYPYTANKVFLVLSESSRVLYVYKEMDYSKSKSIHDRAQFEVKCMKLFLNDDMFVQYKDHEDKTDELKYCILTLYYQGGDLDQLCQYKIKRNNTIKIKKNHRKVQQDFKYIKERHIWNYIERLTLILEKLSHHKIAHLDIKPLNLFIGEDGKIVLGDFGCSSHFIVDANQPQNQNAQTIMIVNNENHSINESSVSPITLLTNARGTRGYYSPESKQKQYYSKSDVYSLGCTLLKLLSCHPDDIANRNEFVENHKNGNFNVDLVKISSLRYSDALIRFVKELLIATHQDRLSPNDDLTVEDVGPYTQKITAPFLIDNRKIDPDAIELIFDGEFNSPLRALLPPTLLKLKLFGKFNQPIGYLDIPVSVETLIFGPSFNSPLDSTTLGGSLKAIVFGRSFNQRINLSQLKNPPYYFRLKSKQSDVQMPIINITTDIWNKEKQYNIFPKVINHEFDIFAKVIDNEIDIKHINIYHTGRGNVHSISTLNSFTNIHMHSKIILTIGEKCFGIGEINTENNVLSWKRNYLGILFKIDLKDVSVISFVQASKYEHLFYQIEKSFLKKQLKQNYTLHVKYPLVKMDKLFKLDNDNIHQMFEHDHQYLNIRFIPVPTEQDIEQQPK
ncbi:hypothetical protein DFA_02923 [Cavenderia fasciculata]|uniref:Protein kinase domain-containing protein n=1 Tax=Cavenderia fasciculata TaxID=261658 RepID=F4PG45_CACFS|nr:uncharacterized protein DFA_02923 [Cavenderia fasciculata]EGG24679.1 hypothetical protein DFA_02923 [Cavenderia fasciculata]|eukprot:XP_004362530.1 hypothetical protein DFA_02923 [Cavenderia fasciculata]